MISKLPSIFGAMHGSSRDGLQIGRFVVDVGTPNKVMSQPKPIPIVSLAGYRLWEKYFNKQIVLDSHLTDDQMLRACFDEGSVFTVNIQIIKMMI